MGNSVKRLIHLLSLFMLVVSISVPVGWAREQTDKPLGAEILAWLDKDEVRVQISLDDASDKSELTVSQDGQEKSRTFRREDRLSVAVQLASTEPLAAELATSAGEVYRWEIIIPEETDADKKRLALRVQTWDRRAASKYEMLEIATRGGFGEGSDSESEEQVDEEQAKEDETEEQRPEEEQREDGQDEDEPSSDDQSRVDQDELEKWAEDFYRQFDRGEKPKGTELKAFRNIFEMEPNDTFEKADWLHDNKDAFGKIKTKGDADMWKIRAPYSGVMNVSLEDIPANKNYNLHMFDAAKRELASSERTGNKAENIEGIGVERREWYYIMVKGSGSSYSADRYYRLRASFQTAGAEVQQDPYEHNNSFANAYELGEVRSIKANLHNLQDLDYYRFSIELASTIAVKLGEIPAGMDIDVYLLDTEGNVVGKSEKPKSADEELVVNADPGTYTIKVMASKRSGFTANSYQLSVSTHTIPVILIPGIGGTRLQMEDRGTISEVWLAANDIIWGRGDPVHRRALTLDPVRRGGVEVAPRTPGIRIFPEEEDEGFRAIEYLSYDYKSLTEQYNSMVKELEKQGYAKGRTLFAMPYDWRYSNTTNARHLKERIDLALQRSGARQVQLVAHSMGGLLARETLLSNVSYQPKVRRVIYMGTPFLGSPRAYQALKFGYDFGVPFLHDDTGRLIAEFSPAVYELLPSKKHHSQAPFLMKNEKDKYSYTDFQRLVALQIPYAPLLNQAIKLHDRWENKTIGNVQQYSIVGTGQPTLMGYRYNSSNKTFTPYYDKSTGDGTVPFVSANYAQKDIVNTFYVNGAHAKLPSMKEVIEQVVRLLKGNDRTGAGVSKSAKKNNPYLYYMLTRDDGQFPVVTIQKKGRQMTIQADRKEFWEDLPIERHGNLVVIHSLDLQPLDFQLPPEEQSGLRIRVFSSEFSKKDREEGKEYLLEHEGLIEAP